MILSFTDVISLLLLFLVIGLSIWTIITAFTIKLTKKTVVISKPRRQQIRQQRGFIDFETGKRVDINPLTKREEFVR